MYKYKHKITVHYSVGLVIAWWQLHKTALSNIEQVLLARPHKTAAERPPTTHHENYQSKMNQTCGTLLEKQGRIQKQYTPVDEQRQDDQLEPIYNSSVSIQDAERGSGRSVLAVWHDDDKV